MDIENKFIEEENRLLTQKNRLHLASVSPLDKHKQHFWGHLKYVFNIHIFNHLLKHVPYLFKKTKKRGPCRSSL